MCVRYVRSVSLRREAALPLPLTQEDDHPERYSWTLGGLRKEQEARKRKDRLPVSVRHGLRQLRKEQAGALGVLRKELERVSVRTAPL